MRLPAHSTALRLAGISLALLLASAPSPAAADDVHLTNGQVFEGVVARRDGDTVRIRMASGEMGFPASWVERIERSESVLGAYLERRGALEPGGTAAEWLELAAWAHDRGFSEGAREAGLRAAALDPRLDGLEPILRAAGYSFDQESGEWLTEGELMARRGYVRVAGQWLPASVVAERERAARSARAEAERAAREERMERAIALLALAQLEERAAEEAEPPAVGLYGGIYGGLAPVAVFPGHFAPRRPRAAPRHHRHHRRPPARRPPPESRPPEHNRGGFSYEALAGRQPGSIITLSADPGAERGRRDGD